MKIGILSMQKIHNYGSFLQAFSLKRNLEELGHDVYFIDIIPGSQIVQTPHKTDAHFYISKLDKYIVKRIKHYFFARRMKQMYIAFQEKYLEIKRTLPDLFDLVIIGSDEVFNCTTPSPWGFSPQLFGEITNARKVITYAASCGSTDFQNVCSFGLENEISNALNKLAYISVRDKNTADFVKLVSGRECEINLDPVFMYDFSKLIPNKLNRRKYVLIYAYTNRIEDEHEISAIKNFAKERELDIVSVGLFQKWCPVNLVANPFELLEYVIKSEYIITDTFHGAVFSIKYGKKFCAIIRDSNYNKLNDLLQRFNLGSQLLTTPMELANIIDNNDVDINSIIAEEHEHFHKYINKCLE